MHDLDELLPSVMSDEHIEKVLQKLGKVMYILKLHKAPKLAWRRIEGV